jgi:quaternary ammonium compound-resistance protein SugE
MHWVILLVSAVLEAVWATALGESEGFTRPVPVAVFLVGVTLSMLGLGYAMREIPIGTAYAVWTGTGAAQTVTYAMATGTEPVTFLRILFIAGIVGAVVGLKVVKPRPVETPSGAD